MCNLIEFVCNYCFIFSCFKLKTFVQCLDKIRESHILEPWCPSMWNAKRLLLSPEEIIPGEVLQSAVVSRKEHWCRVIYFFLLLRTFSLFLEGFKACLFYIVTMLSSRRRKETTTTLIHGPTINLSEKSFTFVRYIKSIFICFFTSIFI